MFSPMRMIKCSPQFVVGHNAVDLSAHFHEDWIRLAQRGRYAVLEAMGASLCAEMPGTPVELHMECDAIDGSVETWPVYDVCTVKHL
jgi:hypothetical protein